MQHPTAPPAHAAHDPLVVAAYAAGDATGAQLDEAAGLVATCADCAALHHDLRAIARSLPATAASAPSPRPRDFRLTADQAAALRPSGWRRLLAPLAGPAFAFARPLGTGLATIGLAGLLVAGASGMPLGGAASAPAGTAGGAEEAYAPLVATGASPAPVPAEDPLFQDNAAATEAPAAGGTGPAATPDPAPKESDQRLAAGAPADAPSGEPMAATEAVPFVPPSSPAMPAAWIAGAGFGALALGVLLLTLRWAARRVA